MEKIFSNNRGMQRSWLKGLETSDIISLGLLEPLGPISWTRIRHGFPSATAFLKAGEGGWRAFGLANAQIQSLVNRPTNTGAAQRLLRTKDISIVTIDDDDYPKLLKEINDPPLWLYYRGNLKTADRKSLTIVGTRKPSTYALAALKSLVSDELAAKIVITSGLAYGIDKAAHERSLSVGGRTVAVLAGGLDTIYPADHHRLAEKIVEHDGLLLSEYPPLDRPKPWKFPVRNRILAGLSPATIVIEAKIKSGSLTTAKSAIDYNRDLFAVPGDISRQQAEGTNFLIKRGAGLIDDPTQLESYFDLKTKRHPTDNLSEELKKFVSYLAREPKTIDQLIELSELPVETVLGLITQLELMEVIRQDDSGQYCLRK